MPHMQRILISLHNKIPLPELDQNLTCENVVDFCKLKSQDINPPIATK